MLSRNLMFCFLHHLFECSVLSASLAVLIYSHYFIQKSGSRPSTNFTGVSGVKEIGILKTNNVNCEKQTQTLINNTQGPLNQSMKLSTMSPGKGFWRKQLEHILGHVRQYTLETPEFQRQIADQRFGKIAEITVEEDDDYSTIHIDFRIVPDATYGEVKSKYKQAAKEFVQTRKIRSTSADSLIEKRKTVPPQKVVRKNVERQSRPQSRVSKLNEQSEELLKELQMPDQNIDDVIRLIDEGADANAKSSNGVPALGIAVANNFIEAIKPLIDAGADVNVKYGSNGNTCLHEAVALGHVGFPMVKTLVGLGSDVEIKNKRGETPHDSALRLSNAEAAELLAAHLSHKMLTKI